MISLSNKNESSIWFYRKYKTDDFVPVAQNPFDEQILFVKEDVEKQRHFCLCPVHLKWEKVESETENAVITENCILKGIKEEYIGKDKTVVRGHYSNLEEYWGSDLFKSVKRGKKLMHELPPEDFRKYIKEYGEYLRLFNSDEKKQSKCENSVSVTNNIVSNNVHRDVMFYHIIINTKKLTLTIEQYAVNRLSMEREWIYANTPYSEIPFVVVSKKFDVKKGSVNTLKNQVKNFFALAGSMHCIDGLYYPQVITTYCAENLKKLICKMLKRQIYFRSSREIVSITSFSRYWLSLHNENDSTPWELYLESLVYSPYDQVLYYSLMFDPKDFCYDKTEARSSFFSKYRLNPNAYYEYCKNLEVTSFKSLRKEFLKNPFAVTAYKCLKDFGFNDVNIIMSIIKYNGLSEWIINYKEDLKFFFNWAIPLKGEKNAWNLVAKELCQDEREVVSYDLERRTIYMLNEKAIDGIRMFRQAFDNLDYNVRQQILSDGFTEYNHDLLSKVITKMKHPNVKFSYNKQDLDFEDKIDGYSFILPKDYNELVDVASNLHNCVASYVDNIVEKKCLIVYAKKDDEYRLCMEIRNYDYVHQQRADRNRNPVGEDSEVLKNWRQKHGLKFTINRY